MAIFQRFQVAGHNAADWTAGNPVLLDREWAVERDTGKVKLGDGVTAWNSLPYFGAIVTGFTGTIGVGGATPAGTGAGVSFPATQSASSDPNTLDDYEEGTWTPVVTASSGSLTTYTASGAYTKIGRLVTVTAEISITANGTGAVGLAVTLPFACNGTIRYFGQGRERGLSGKMIQVGLDPGATSVALQLYDNAYPGGSGSQPSFSIAYHV